MVSIPNPLWERIERYNTDEPGHQFPFSAKLAREQGWTRSFTERAIFEYKRFVYLCCISPQGASPPPVVDEVWHLHLTYTRSYWQDFCRNCLQQELHHQPSAGGTGELHRHREWYADTLGLYERVFGSQPPPDIWPPEEAADPGDLPKSRTSLVLLLAGAGCMLPVYYAGGPVFLICFALFLAWCSIVRWVHFRKLEKAIAGYILDHLSLNLQDFAWLTGNRQRVRQLVFADGIQRRALSFESGLWHIDTARLHREAAFYADWFDGAERLTMDELLHCIDARSALQAARFDPVKRRLDRDTFPRLLYGVPIILGVARIVQGLVNDRPVTYLIVELICYFVIVAGIRGIPGFHRSMARNIHSDPVLSGELAATGIAGVVILYGMSTLVNDPAFSGLGPSVLADWPEPKRPWLESEASDSGGSSSSCSSGGCGSSCGGGCGGCGGGD